MSTQTEPATEQARCGLRCHRMDEHGLCVRCSDLTRSDLRDIPQLWATLHALDDIPDCQYPHARLVDGELVPAPCSCARPASGQLMPGQAGGDKVSGSRDAPIGVRVAVLSFIGPRTVDHRPMRLDVDNQVGELPLLDTLWSWVRLMVEEHPDRLHGPKPTLAAPQIQVVIGWLLARHDWAMQQMWADDYAHEIRLAVDHAKRLTGDYDEQPELKVGVPCRRCLYMTLVRNPGETDIVCSRRACQQVLRPEEYTDWAKMYAANPRRAVDDAERARWLHETADALAETPGLRRYASQMRAQARALDESA